MKKYCLVVASFVSTVIFSSTAFSQTFPPYSSFPSQTFQGGSPFPVNGVPSSSTDYIPAFRFTPGPGVDNQLLLVGEMPLGAFASANQLQQLNIENRQGIATAIAMANASMPSAPGRTSWALNATEYRGEQALGGALSHRFGTSIPLAVDVGFAVSGSTHIIRAGLQGEF